MSSRNIKDCIQELQFKYPKILELYEIHNPGYTLIITCTHRPVEEQYELYKQGRTFDIYGNVIGVNRTMIVTNVDGRHRLSSHNPYPAYAFDVAVKDIKTERILWDEGFYHALVPICEQMELESGGNWATLKDWPHIQSKTWNPKEHLPHD